jgi:hypothetical protein
LQTNLVLLRWEGQQLQVHQDVLWDRKEKGWSQVQGLRDLHHQPVGEEYVQEDQP